MPLDIKLQPFHPTKPYNNHTHVTESPALFLQNIPAEQKASLFYSHKSQPHFFVRPSEKLLPHLPNPACPA